MGATSWHYFAPYRESAENALQALRQEVFARGDYSDPTGDLEDHLRSMCQRIGLEPNSPDVRRQVNEAARLQHAIDSGDLSGLSRGERGLAERVRNFTRLAEQLGAQTRSRPSGARPDSIEELLERAEEAGTHSILDIEAVAARPRPGAAAPLSASARRKHLGAEQPTHAQVEQRWADIADSLKRLHCRYLVVYEDGQPSEYAFIGCSGD